MSKHKRRRHKRSKAPNKPVPMTESSFAKSHKLLLEILGLFATLLTIAGFALTFLIPKLSIDIAGSLQPTSPMGTVFYLSNDGSLAIHDVEVTMGNLNIVG